MEGDFFKVIFLHALIYFDLFKDTFIHISYIYIYIANVVLFFPCSKDLISIGINSIE